METKTSYGHLIRVECTWGQADDVSMSFKSEQGCSSVDLTADEADQIGHQLICAAAHARELESVCEEHDKYMENENGND